VELITEEFEIKDVGEDKEFFFLKQLKKNRKYFNDQEEFDSPVLQAIQGLDLKPWYMKVKSSHRIGYTFFEKDLIHSDDIRWAKDYYDTIVAGSSWCEKILNARGFSNTRTIIQGIDANHYNSGKNEKSEYMDHFVIFSGGKLELRKGQDLVIRAIKILQDKYPDVLLVNLWYNQWAPSMDTMRISPYIRFEMPKGDYFRAINHLFKVNGIDADRVITLPPIPNNKMSEIYQNTDLGLFPNRCEGGTNLVLMEYMACGKPVIASYSSGHKDVLTDDNSIPVKSLHPFKVQDQDGNILYQWEEPNLDEIVSALEWAYWHRDDLRNIGKSAGEDLSKFTWEDAAMQFYELFN